ncbi:integrase, partial [Bifidobacterium longum subsp. infantis]
MGEVCSHLSEEERQVIQIEIGNGTSVRGIGLMPGRNASTAGGEIRRNTWLPSDENGSCRPCRPKRLKTGPWTGGYYIAGPARRRADRRRARSRRRHRPSCGRPWARAAEWPGRGWSPPPVGG